MTTEKIQQRIKIARYAKDMGRAEMYKLAGRADLERNWRQQPEQSPTLGALGDLSGVLDVDPAWLAYGDKPQPCEAMPGYHTQPTNRLSPKMDMIHRVWTDEGLGVALFEALERTGLASGIYLLGHEDYQLKYDHIGGLARHMFGCGWWMAAHGKFVGEIDPDPELAYGCLRDYRDSYDNKIIRMDNCEATSWYTGEGQGWRWQRLILPCDGGRLLIVNEVVA